MDLEHSVEEKIKELDEFIITNPDVREFKRALAVKLALQGWKYQANCLQQRLSSRRAVSFIKKFCKQMEKSF